MSKAKTYGPKGRMPAVLAAMQAEPSRVWTAEEAAAVMGIAAKKFSSYAQYALIQKAMYSQKQGRRVFYSASPFPDQKDFPAPVSRKQPEGEWQPDPGDLRIPRVVPGWRPPVMVCQRVIGGAA